MTIGLAGAVVCLAILAWLMVMYLVRHTDYTADESRAYENEYRLILAINAGMSVYSHEDADGSLSWRRVTAR